MLKRTVRLFVERLILPKRRLKLRVRSGLSQGLWIHARLPEEVRYWRGDRERITEQTILAVVREGCVVYDVGAHVGAITFGAARLVGETGRVVAFEADPENVVSLRESCVWNHFEQRVQVVHAAVWSHNATAVPFRRGATRLSHGSVVVDGYPPILADGATLAVPSMTLDAFIALDNPKPNLIKIDVEGGEFEVLRGGQRLFTCDRPLLLVEVHHARAFEKIENWLDEFHYSGRWNVPGTGFPRMLIAWPSESQPPDL